MERKIGLVRVTLERGDITKHAADAIVNAANSGLLGGGGVDGAIHRAGGPVILEECKRIREEKGTCPTGQAVATSAGNLPARFVFHAVGPRWGGGDRGEAGLLASCYGVCLALADEREVESIAFPSISTGIYGYPVEEAAGVAVRAVRDHLAAHPDSSLRRVTWVLFDATTFAAYEAALGAP